jgi:psp operon transcriptional activator
MALDLGWPGFPGFGRPALDALLAHPWPGNVRELKNVVERAICRAGSTRRAIAGVEFDPFASPFRPGTAAGSVAATPAPAERPPDVETIRPARDDAVDYRAALAAFERGLLEQALARNRHNQRAAAAELDLTYDQLRHQLRKHGLLRARR